MLLGTQYYRPPFPDRARWGADLRAIKDAGLGAIELLATWAWHEPEPGRYDFDDVDALFDAAADAGLEVIVTAFADLHPYWIHRVVPGSEMVDHRGRRVESTTLAYTHAGLSPGGCTDNPAVRERMGSFLTALAAHCRARPNLRNWDCWNELRWSVHADGHVCFCEHTVGAWRAWLRARHGDLDGLNAAWRRRYADWADVQPGKQPERNWTETISFHQFLAWRAAEHASFRREALLRGDPTRPVIAHAVLMSPLHNTGETPWEPPLARGDVWEMASRVDGFGISLFPYWAGQSNVDYATRLEVARSAAGERPLWVAELQGGAVGNGFAAYPGIPAERQQRWIWSGYGRGAKAVVFWCWRDEVFGREAAGFGVAGDDGFADERLGALARTGAVLREHEALLDAYEPAPARVGVLFEPVNHMMEWAASGTAADQSHLSMRGVLRCLERRQLPYDVLSCGRLPALDAYRVLFAPWPHVIRPEVGEALAAWVRAGGTLVVEAELDAFDEHGFYRYPGERPLPAALGFRGHGRRPLGDVASVAWALDGLRGELRTATWLEPLSGEPLDGEAASSAGAGLAEPLATCAAGTVMLRRRVGAGTAIVLGTHAALAYEREPYDDYERFVEHVVERAGGAPDVRCDLRDGERVSWRHGHSAGAMLLFACNEGEAREVTFTGALGDAAKAHDLLTGRTLAVERTGPAPALRVPLDANGAHVFVLGAER